MSYAYPGNPNNNPANITLPEDGDNADAASVEVPFEGLKDSVAYLTARLGTHRFMGVHTFWSHVGAPLLNVTGVVSAVYELGQFAVEVGDLVVFDFFGVFSVNGKCVAQFVHDIDHGALFVTQIGFFPNESAPPSPIELSHAAHGSYTAIATSTDIGVRLQPDPFVTMKFSPAWRLTAQIWRPI